MRSDILYLDVGSLPYPRDAIGEKGEFAVRNDTISPTTRRTHGAAVDEPAMRSPRRYDPRSTALVLVDPYNDFFSRAGRAWPMVRDVAREGDVLENLAGILSQLRARDVPVVYAPHRRYRPGVFSGRDHPAPSHVLVKGLHLFKDGGYGGRFHRRLARQPGDTLASEHDTSCGFAGTDLDEQLRRLGTRDVVLAGGLSNTCIEATGRTAADHGYRVTFLVDCVVALTKRDHVAAVLNYERLGNSMRARELLARLAVQPDAAARPVPASAEERAC
jgi:nicotinamidase-related amidase